MFEKSYKIRVSARAVVISDGRLLLNRWKQGEYVFPGGGIEEGETAAQTVVREVREETGLVVRADNFLFTLEYEPQNTGFVYGNGHHISLFFRCAVIGDTTLQAPSIPDVDPDDPANLAEPVWIPVDQLPGLRLLPRVNENLLEYLKTGVFEPRLIEEPYGK